MCSKTLNFTCRKSPMKLDSPASYLADKTPRLLSTLKISDDNGQDIGWQVFDNPARPANGQAIVNSARN
jgi:hypothetical protein